MIVLDASVVVELLINSPLAAPLRAALAARDESILVPHLLDIEVLSALRKLTARSRVDSYRSSELLAGLAALPAQRCPHTPFADRIWELRHNFTAYDAAYIALAEWAGAVLYTSDKKLCKGHRAQVAPFSVHKNKNYISILINHLQPPLPFAPHSRLLFFNRERKNHALSNEFIPGRETLHVVVLDFRRVMSPNGVPYWDGRRRKTLGREPITPGGIRIALIAAHRSPEGRQRNAGKMPAIKRATTT